MKIHSAYLFAGEEIFLVEEVLSSTLVALNKNGFIERHLFDQDNRDSWEKFHYLMQAQSLFAEKMILHCRFSTQKVSEAAKKALSLFIQTKPADKVLIMVFSKLSREMQNASWFQQLKQGSHFTPIWPVTLKQFPHLIKQRLQQKGFQIDNACLQLLCDYTEGNLLAAMQCIQKIELLYEPGQLTEEQVLALLSKSAQYSVFDLTNAIAQKNHMQMKSILDTLRAQSVEPAIVLWALARECRRQRQAKYIPLLNDTDQSIKGLKAISPWLMLERLSFALSGAPLS